MARHAKSSSITEAARAAALAAHSAASLCAVARRERPQGAFGEAARLLRASEALARAAAAALCAGESHLKKENAKGGDGTVSSGAERSGGEASSAAKHRRRKRKSKAKAKAKAQAGSGHSGWDPSMDVDEYGELGFSASSRGFGDGGTTDLIASLQQVSSAFSARFDDAGVPRGDANGAFPQGSRVQVVGLEARPELNLRQGFVIDGSSATGNGRVAVRLDGPESEKVQVKPANLVLMKQ